MRRFVPLLGLVLSCPPPSQADLILNGRSTVVAMGMQGAGQEKIWLSNTLIRRDMLDRGKSYTNLFDLKAREVTVLDHSLRQATVYATDGLRDQAGASVDGKAIKLEVKATGRTHELQKWTCAEHTLMLSMPAEIGGEKLNFEMDGTVWLARNTREQKETAAIVRLMQSPDFFLGIPPLAKASPVQARGISEAIRRLAPMGLLCSVDVALNYEGTGRVATLSRKMASRVSLTFDDYSVQPIPKGTFDVPAGYRMVGQ
ncbi:MAG TPA: hypothetical protein PKH69_12310 [Thiobacillaceae bacterium]|nr:hypothetical protein [Thiobacillaceae bacterium]HNU65293.1 hypothetical protein [Thiobacillaceae bacterium]